MFLQLYLIKLYHSCYKELRNHFSHIFLNTTLNNVHFFNQINGKITSSGVINPETINPHDFFHECSKHGPDFVFGKLRIKAFSHEPYFPEIIE